MKFNTIYIYKIHYERLKSEQPYYNDNLIKKGMEKNSTGFSLITIFIIPKRNKVGPVIFMCILRFIRFRVIIRNRTRDFPLSGVSSAVARLPGLMLSRRRYEGGGAEERTEQEEGR